MTFPIWLYVSVTGVVIYLMLYHLPRRSSGHLYLPLDAADRTELISRSINAIMISIVLVCLTCDYGGYRRDSCTFDSLIYAGFAERLVFFLDDEWHYL